MKKLRIFRILLSLGMAVIYFLALGGLSLWAAKLPVFAATPAWLAALGGTSLAGIAIAAFWALLALAAGRVYCGMLCPLGLWQDGVMALRKLLPFRRKGTFRKDHRKFRYCWTGFLFALALTGTVLPLALLEPFAFAGKIGNNLLRPALEALSVWLWSDLRLDWVTPLVPHPLTPLQIWYTALAALLLTVLTWWQGRIFCTLLCPMGTLLGLAGRVSFWGIKLDREQCIKCRKCEKNCPADCIDLDAGEIDPERCLRCFNCLALCPVKAISAGSRKIAGDDRPADPARREFLLTAAGGVAAGAVCGTILQKTLPAQPSPMPVMPPGAGNLDRFLSKCTACGLCMEHCPGSTLKPAGLQYGWQGIGMPLLSFELGKCEFDCKRCSSLCPNGALQEFPALRRKQLTRIGMVEYFRNRCVVTLEKRDCGACAEHCPTGALRMVPYENGLTIPKVFAEFCIGCGSCQYICPTRPHAMVVTGVAQQGAASEPRAPDTDAPPAPAAGDFPF